MRTEKEEDAFMESLPCFYGVRYTSISRFACFGWASYTHLN